MRTGPAAAAVSLLFLMSLLPWSLRLPKLLGPVVVFLVFGTPAALEALGNGLRMDVHSLMTAAAFASAAIGHSHEGALLLLLFAGSEILEDRLSMAAQSSLDALSQLSPETAHRLVLDEQNLSGNTEDVHTAELRVGDLIMVRAGEVVPVDGKILEGESQVGLDHLTGEPLPQAMAPGNVVMSGARNIDGALLLEVQRPADESTVQRISRLTAQAQSSRPKLVTFLDAVGENWSRAVIFSTAALAILPPLLFKVAFGDALYKALGWLITASPCALILATPLVYVSALSAAASNGVLLKGGRSLDALAVANGVAFDKTGTITTGVPTLEHVEEVFADTGASRKTEVPHQRAQALAAALGRLSVHPVSRALAAAEPQGMHTEVTGFQLAAGAGVSGSVSLAPEEAATETALGRPEFVAQRLEGHGSSGDDAALADALRRAVKRVAPTDPQAGRDGGYGGSIVTALSACQHNGEQSRAWLFSFSDRVKASAPEILKKVSERGPMYMLTGDRKANSLGVAQQLASQGVDFTCIHADLRPEEKLAHVRELDEALRRSAASRSMLGSKAMKALGVSAGGLAMVGDGVNDAPALAAATIGISLAAHADGALPGNAVEGSDVLVLRRANDPVGDRDLERVEWVFQLAKRARDIVRQNVCLALGSICVASSATLFTTMPLWVGVLLHEGTTMLVALNSLRLCVRDSGKGTQ